MLFGENRIDISYRESQVLKNVAKQYKEKIMSNKRYLIEKKHYFWISIIIYAGGRPLQREIADDLLIGMLSMETDVYNAFTEFINNLVLTDQIMIMHSYHLSNGMRVCQIREYF